MIIDTHSHLNFKDFEKDLDAVLTRCREHQVAIINVGSQISTSERAVQLAEQNAFCFAAVGLHPVHLEALEIEEEGNRFVTRAEEFDAQTYETLTANPKVVAIGECGLDYYHIASLNNDIVTVKAKQKAALQAQIYLANKAGLPMIIHCRDSKENPGDAYHDLLLEIKKNLPTKRGVIHSFGSTWAVAEQFLELGFYIGINGIITFDKTGLKQEIAQMTPLDRILVETDCPYLTPVPFRGQRNEPIYTEYIIQKIAEVKQIQYQEVALQTLRNANSLFKLNLS